MLREGGNAVDAAICAVLTSFVAESQLTGFGAGGFMMVHEDGEDSLIDFFVAAGGADGIERKAELIPVPVYFDETPQIFNCGAASCGVPGNPAGLEHVRRRFGSVPIARLAEPGHRARARGRPADRRAPRTSTRSCTRSSSRRRRARRCTRPRASSLVEGDTFRYPEMSDALERFAAEGAEPFYRGDIAERGLRVGPRARRNPRAWTTWPPTSRSSAAGERTLPRLRGAHQPAALVGRDPDRVLAWGCSSASATTAAWSRSSRRSEAANARRTDDFHGACTTRPT